MDTFKNACIKTFGNNPQVIELPDFYLTDILEGLGSLNKLADDIYHKTGQDFYFQVGWGNAASILNDLSSLGARPINIKLFVAAGSEKWFANVSHWQNLIKGFKAAAKFSRALWNGGETQTLVGVINPKSIVLGGSATGIIKPKSNIVLGDNIQAGDRIILFGSSGVHTNGITLIRKVFKNDLSVNIEAIKDKTIIYTPLINKLLDKKVKIHYLSHITGHGWRKIMRSPKELSYIINTLPKPHPIFKKIQQKTGMNDAQMYGDYNMGAGMALFTTNEEIKKILSVAKELRINALEAGWVESGPRRVVIKPIGVEFQGSSLQIR